MSSIIVKTNQIHIGDAVYHHTNDKQILADDLATHIGACLRAIPPKQLCRCLREMFMLRLEELQAGVPEFNNFVSSLTILLARLDAEEDGRIWT
jgi:hypothetical protein